MKKVRIKRMFSADFRKSPRTMYDELRKDKKLFSGDPNPDEVYIFVSSTGNQLIFVTGDHEIVNHPGKPYETKQRMLDYRGWRMEGSSFNPLMLEEYANRVGLSLGKKRLSEWYGEHRAARRGE
jgi:hypothetical protein